MLSSKMTQDRIQVAQLLRQMDMFLKQVAQDRCQLAQTKSHEQNILLRLPKTENLKENICCYHLLISFFRNHPGVWRKKFWFRKQGTGEI
jgi:hypothetical protein